MDWLSQLLDIMPVSGRLEVRCLYGAPWRVNYEQSGPGEMPYHVIVAGSAVLEDGPHRHPFTPAISSCCRTAPRMCCTTAAVTGR